MTGQQPSRVDEENILHVAIEAIIPNPRQPRRILSEDDPGLMELSASIKQYGLLQPLVVTRLDMDPASDSASTNDPWSLDESQHDGAPATVIRFQIIAGERR